MCPVQGAYASTTPSSWAKEKDWAHGVAAAVDVTLLTRFYERFTDHAVEMGVALSSRRPAKSLMVQVVRWCLLPARSTPSPG
jgi:phosphate uptake regulator